MAGLFTLLFTRLLGRVRGATLALVGIGLYTRLVGAGLSVVRAALMGETKANLDNNRHAYD